MANAKKTTKRAAGRRGALSAAALQFRRFNSTVAALTALRAALLSNDCPAAIPAGERDAAVQDLSRALAQLGNLRRWYGAGGRRTR